MLRHYPNLPVNQQIVQRRVDRFTADEQAWKRQCPVGHTRTTVSVLGIDAAWTVHEPSGVALVGRGNEDALDALVCAWVGCCYLDGHAKPYGDSISTIWVPGTCS